MKTISRLPHDANFGKDKGEQAVRLIKAAQAGKLLQSESNGHVHLETNGHRKNPEIRLVATGSDYCDLEVICGCGEGTRIRCWNSPSLEEKKA